MCHKVTCWLTFLLVWPLFIHRTDDVTPPPPFFMTLTMNTRRVRPINTGCLLLWGTWSHPYQGSVLLCFKFVVRFMDFWDFIPLTPKNIRMKSYCESSPLGYHFHSRRQQMLPDPDFIPFNTINAEKLPLLSLNIYEVELWKSVVKLRHFKTYILISYVFLLLPIYTSKLSPLVQKHYSSKTPGGIISSIISSTN